MHDRSEIACSFVGILGAITGCSACLDGRQEGAALTDVRHSRGAPSRRPLTC